MFSNSGRLFVGLDLDVVLYGSNTFYGARDRNGFVRRILARGGTAQSHHALVVRIDLNAHQARQLLPGQLGLDLGGYYRVLDKCLGRRTVGIAIGGIASNRQHQRAGQETGCHKFGVHGLFFPSKLRIDGSGAKPIQRRHCPVRNTGTLYVGAHTEKYSCCSLAAIPLGIASFGLMCAGAQTTSGGTETIVAQMKPPDNWFRRQRLNPQGDESWNEIALFSYTHLRAHETRHDLVCRLLLEKKKKK